MQLMVLNMLLYIQTLSIYYSYLPPYFLKDRKLATSTPATVYHALAQSLRWEGPGDEANHACRIILHECQFNTQSKIKTYFNLCSNTSHACIQGKHPTLGTHHAKFTNYSFDVNEFMRLMVKLGQDVQERKMAAYSLSAADSDTTGSDRVKHREEL